MLKIEGSDYKTIADVAKEEFGVSVKTLRQWIDKGIIPTPPKKEYGTRDIEIFTDEYLERAKLAKDVYKKKKNSKKNPIQIQRELWEHVGR
jgi:DNA-binding transcriptional MerR regulator